MSEEEDKNIFLIFVAVHHVTENVQIGEGFDRIFRQLLSYKDKHIYSRESKHFTKMVFLEHVGRFFYTGCVLMTVLCVTYPYFDT